MGPSKESAGRANGSWGDKTLAELREDAIASDAGISFASLRRAGGPRYLLAVCIAKKDQIERLSGLLDFAIGSAPSLDWEAITLREMGIRALDGSGLCFEHLIDERMELKSVSLIAAVPDSVSMLEGVFDLKR